MSFLKMRDDKYRRQNGDQAGRNAFHHDPASANFIGRNATGSLFLWLFRFLTLFSAVLWDELRWRDFIQANSPP
jgi:hypothetical protein